MARRALLFLLIAATAAFSECGDRGLEVMLSQDLPPRMTRVAGSDSVDCTATIRAHIGGTGKGIQVAWRRMHLGASDPQTHASLWHLDVDQAGAAERMGGDGLGRLESRTVELTLRLPRPAHASVMVVYQTLPQGGLVRDGVSGASTAFPCIPAE